MTLDNDTFSCASLMDDAGLLAHRIAKRLEEGPADPKELEKEMKTLRSIQSRVTELNRHEWNAARNGNEGLHHGKTG